MEPKDNKIPSRILKIKFQDNDFEITFPNVGQIIDIETRKTLFSSGQYENLRKNDSIALPYINALATFSILVPELNSLLRVESLFDLNLIDVKELIEIYNKEYAPWYEEWNNFIKK
jgi:hypothetical protein